MTLDRHAHQRRQKRGQCASTILKIELEALRRKYDRAAFPTRGPRKIHRRTLEEKDSADTPLRLARDPEPGPVAPDEERRDRLTQNIGRERLERDRWDVGLAARLRMLVVTLPPPRANRPGLHRRAPESLADKAIEHLAATDEPSAKPLIKTSLRVPVTHGEGGHRGLLAYLTLIMCRYVVGMRDGSLQHLIGNV